MFGSIGFSELLVLFVLALLIFGPRKLPEIARSIGQATRSLEEPVEEVREKLYQFEEEPPWKS